MKQCLICANAHDQEGPYCSLCVSALAAVNREIRGTPEYERFREESRKDHSEPLSSPHGDKDLKNKRMLNLVPLDVLDILAQPLEAGLKKGYTKHSWFNSPQNSIGTYLEAGKRHLMKYERGEDVDDETGVPHLYCVAFNMMAAALYEYYKIEGKDDRFIADKLK